MNYYTDSLEWHWLFRNAVDWDTILPLYYKEYPTPEGFKDKDEVLNFLEELLTATGEWTATAVAGRARKLDEDGAGTIVDGRTVPGELLQKIYDEAKELQAYGLSVSAEHGGLGAPALVSLIAFTQMNRACIAAATQVGFYGTIADMVERFCDRDTAARIVPRIVAGELSGSMCLTEAGAGSDVGAIKTSAVKQADGTYLLNGAKIFITNAAGGLGFVLARVKGAPEGLAGLSLFFVEQDLEVDGKTRLNYRVTKDEHKLGLHGSFTCEVVYEDTVARIIGQENEGFHHMLYLMNEARIGVGFQALGGIEACLAYAREYALTRTQFGKPLLELPLYRRNFEDWETERDAIRAMLVDTGSHFDIYQRLDLELRHTGELCEDKRKQHQAALKWVRRRTPLVKYYCAEAYTKLSQMAVQALGGYGFMREYDAERYHRDSFGPLLYEGTSQIQALMAMKDVMKYIMKNPGRFFQTIFYSHPFGVYFSEDNEYQRDFINLQYRFKKALSSLLMRVFKPGLEKWDFAELAKLFKAKTWFTEEKFELLMEHAETLCQAMAYLETLRVLAVHATREPGRGELFRRYAILVKPRFAAIFEDWDVR